MIELRRWSGLVLSLAVLNACGENSEGALDANDVGVATSALSACNETVPDTRYIDGIPSYAQCDASESAAIYSNNGIDTATTSMGTGWIRTQYSGGYQCTELAHRYLYFKWNVKWIPNGNAGAWCDTMPPANSGVTQTMAPVHGDIMVLAPGSCGADATTGHVNVVDIVDTAKARLTVVEQNGARRGNYMQSCGKCFLHVVANDGMNPGTAIVPAPPVGVAGAPAAGASAAGSPSQTGGSAAPPSGRPAPAGAAAPPPPSEPAPTPKPTTPTTTAHAGSSAPPPLMTTPIAAGSGASEAPAPVSRAGATDEGGCSVGSAPGSSRSPLSAAGASIVLAALAVHRSRRRTRRA
jgi:MYXO-CTERM domain-containing protein